MLEGWMRVHLGETAVKDRNAHALAVDVAGLELLALHQRDLVEGGVHSGNAVLVILLRDLRQGGLRGDELHTRHKRQLLHRIDLGLGSHHRLGVQPA